jgi:hypothetical protein
VLEKLAERRITQAEAAIELGLSLRQIQRLHKQYQTKGIRTLASKKRGKPGNRKMPRFLVARVAEIVTSERYVGQQFPLKTRNGDLQQHVYKKNLNKFEQTTPIRTAP